MLKVHELLAKYGFAILENAVSMSRDAKPLVYCDKRQAGKVSQQNTKREWIYDSVVVSNQSSIVDTHPTATIGGRQQMVLAESLAYTAKYGHQLKAILEGVFYDQRSSDWIMTMNSLRGGGFFGLNPNTFRCGSVSVPSLIRVSFYFVVHRKHEPTCPLRPGQGRCLGRACFIPVRLHSRFRKVRF
jgi:hypothetical protein